MCDRPEIPKRALAELLRDLASDLDDLDPDNVPETVSCKLDTVKHLIEGASWLGFSND